MNEMFNLRASKLLDTNNGGIYLIGIETYMVNELLILIPRYQKCLTPWQIK